MPGALVHKLPSTSEQQKIQSPQLEQKQNKHSNIE